MKISRSVARRILSSVQRQPIVEYQPGLLRCLIGKHKWARRGCTPWAEVRACKCCGRIEQRQFRGVGPHLWREVE